MIFLLIDEGLVEIISVFVSEETVALILLIVMYMPIKNIKKKKIIIL